MQVGVALPQMAVGYDRSTTLDWCRGIDQGPFSSVSAGERITFRNHEMITLLAAAAALTERVEIFANVTVTPWHRLPLLAKQFSTIDVLSAGRLAVAVGVGGREVDYAALDAPFARRHQRVDDDVAELRRIWSGGSVGADAAPGTETVGPFPVRPGGPKLYGSPLGPKSMARSARWADGISAFSLAADPAEAARLFAMADEAWAAAGRTDRPHKRCGLFYVLGGDDPKATLASFAYDYLEVFSPEFARILADQMPVYTAEVLAEKLAGFAAVGCDELILVPGDADPRCLELAAEVVSSAGLG
jgi:alkanesulfonate monooxygenase SsuD/methylene tetrahydromethanopterin reductase-like flavin-dependent oxidoreductase (luciferase family)